MMKKQYNSSTRLLYAVEDVWYVFVQELRRIFTDKGVMLIFFLAGFLYPVLYNCIYNQEVIHDIPVAVVDESHSEASRRYIHKFNATSEVCVAYHCQNMAEAQDLFNRKKVRGILYIPPDYSTLLSTVSGQATISVYCDVSSFLYYKNMMIASNFVMLDEHKNIQIARYNAMGLTGESAEQIVQPLPYDDVMLYNSGGGFASFLLPAILILILHQTLFFGIGMLAGTAREDNEQLFYIPGRSRDRSVSRIICGRALAYFLIYAVLAAYTLGLIPVWFNMPRIGSIVDVYKLMVPFLLATIFFSITISVFVRNRETGLVTMLFFTIILLFLSGFSWPQSNMPLFWRYISYLFPSTFGIQGYLHINTMGATLAETRFEYVGLWIQAGVYFATACISYWISGWRYERFAGQTENLPIVNI